MRLFPQALSRPGGRRAGALCPLFRRRHGGGTTAATILYGRTVGNNAGTTADFFVDNVNGSDAAAGTVAAPFATVAHAASTASSGQTIALRDSGQPYLEALSSTKALNIRGYGTEQPKWYGSFKVTGLTQCTVADAGFLGPVAPASVYKATFAKSALSHSSFHALLPLENGTPLNLAQVRHDTTDLFFQDNSDAFFAATSLGDTVTIATASRNVVQVNKKGAANGSDVLFINAPVTSIVAVNQGGTWNGSSFVGGTTYTATTDYTLSGQNISWAPAGAEPVTGTSYTVVFAATVISTITHAAALGNGTTPYTDAQLAKCGVMIRCSPNESIFFNVTGSSGGVLTVETLDQTKDGSPTGDCYSLLNIAPALVAGQYAYDASDPTNLTIYVFPNNAADMAAGVLVAAKNNVLTFSQCSNPSVQNIEFGHTADDTTGLAAVILDRVTASVATPVMTQCTVQYVSHRHKGYGCVLLTGGSGVAITLTDFKNAQNQFGPFVFGTPNATTNHRIKNNYCYRIAQSPWRVYGGSTLPAVVDNKLENCGVSAHANKGNFYQGCDQYLCLRNWWINCGGYLTNQQSSRGMFLMNLCPTDPSSTDGRAFDDQTGSISPPVDPSSNYQFNNAYPRAGTNPGSSQSLTLVPDSVPHTLYNVDWKVRNNVSRGILTDAGHLVDTPDFNVFTDGTTVGAHDTPVTDTDSIFYDYTASNFNTVPGSILTSKTGADISADVATFEALFPDINFRMTLNGFPWDPADPGVGPYGKHWPVQIDTVAPVLSSLTASISGATASCSVTTNERGGAIYWVRYHTGSVPSGAQVVAGQDSTGSAALSSGTVSVANGPGAYPFSVTGTQGVTDTLAVVHKDRSGNISLVSTASLPFAIYAPTWVDLSAHDLTKATPLTGFQASTKNAIYAFAISETSAQLAVGLSGGVLTNNGAPSTNLPKVDTTSTGKLIVKQSNSTNVSIANITVPTSALVAGTQYVGIVSFHSDAVNGFTFKAVIVNVATGAVVAGPAPVNGADCSLVFANNYTLFSAGLSAERFMLWDNPSITPDAASAAIQQLFVGSSGGLVDPATSVGTLGTPIISICDGNLSTGTNAGSGGNFTFV